MLLQQDLEYQREYAKYQESSDRLGFIRKVYAILSIQLTFTVIICSIAVSSRDVAEWMQDNIWLYFVFVVLSIAFLLPLVCCRQVAKTVPKNYILLIGFTICESFVVAWFCGFYVDDRGVVLAAALMTLGITVALTIYAFVTRSDFTTCIGSLVVVLFAFILFGIVLAIMGTNQILAVVFSTLGVIIYGIFIVIDTQMIAGGRKAQFTYDDYIIAALNIYIDVIGLFIYLVQLLGALKR